MGAHPDDIELVGGALLADIVGRTELYCMTFSDNKKTGPARSAGRALRQHAHPRARDDQIEVGTLKPADFRTSGRKSWKDAST